MLSVALITGVGGYYLGAQDGWYAFGGISLASFLFTYACFHRSCTEYIVTEARVEVIAGFLRKSSFEVRVCDIRAINVRQSGLKGLLGIGTVEFASAGSDSIEVSFPNVRRPHRIKALVRQLQDNA